LQGAEGAEDRVEEQQEDQGAMMVEVALAITGLVALTADVVGALEEWQSFIGVLEPLELGSGDRVVGRRGHAKSPPGLAVTLPGRAIAQILCRTDVT
jgi:hypothetical protein